MTELVLETIALRKAHRRPRHGAAAVQDLDLAVPRGAVHGLLGPHGAGKTTVLRVLTGLARPTSGRVRLFGLDVPAHQSAVQHRIGAVVGGPRLSASMTGRRNLQLLARAGGVPASRVERVVAQVGLDGREHDRVRTYSPASRQRLGIAAALLRSPELLLLDEPTTGLDPAAARGLRDLVRDLGSSGITILLASHLLAEVQQVCETVTVLDQGRPLSTGPVADLVGRQPGGGVRVGVADAPAALAHLAAAGLRATQDGQHLYVEDVRDPAEITRLLAEHGHYVRELTPDLAVLHRSEDSGA